MKQVSKGTEDAEDHHEQLLCGDNSSRPQTAPPDLNNTKTHMFTNGLEPPLVRRCHDPPPRPPRPDSDVLRHVNAWLDTSVIKPDTKIKTEITSRGHGAGASETMQPETKYTKYTIPIVEAEETRNTITDHGRHQPHFFTRRAKKREVKIPFVHRSRSHRAIRPRSISTPRRSLSMPLLSLDTERGEASTLDSPVSSRSLMDFIPCTSDHSSLSSIMRRIRTEDMHNSRPGTSTLSEAGGAESRMDRRINAFCQRAPTLVEFPRLAGSINGVMKQGSTGNLSEAPTYSSGVAPPSYRSRAVSIRSTSSFGCVDGMSAEYRRQKKYERQQKRDRSVKERLKRFAQKARLRI